MLKPWQNWTHTNLLGDPFNPTRNITTLPLFFGGPMDKVTKDVCREISSSHVTSTSSSSRCMTLLSQSIRSQRIRATTADADLYDFRRDGLILMLTYVYDDDSMVYSNNNSVSHVDYYCPVDMQHHHQKVCSNTTQPRHRPQICVFGEFSLQITALASLMRYNLHWVFTSRNDEILSTPEALDKLISTWQNDGLHLTYTTAIDTNDDNDNGFSWQSLLRKQGTETDVVCDVWHFRVDTAGHLLTHIFTNNSDAISRAAQVVWESTMNVGDTLDMSKPPDILPSVLHWDAFSLWPVCTNFNGMIDAEGFSGARAVALDFKYDLRLYSMWIGHIQPLSMDSYVPLTTSTTTEDDKITSMMNREEDIFTTMTTNPTVVIAITYTNRVFDDNAYGLRDVLLSLGYHHVFVMGDFSLTTVRQWYHRFPPTRKNLFLQIALGPHELCMLTPNYIAYNMEQPWSMYFTDASHSVGYRMLLAGALAIFTFSNHHRDGIIQLSKEYDLCIRADRIFNIPIYITTENGPEIHRPLFRKNSYMSSLFSNQDNKVNNIIGKEGAPDDVEEDHAYDIAFFGGSSARRLAFFERFQEHSERHQFNFRVVCGGWEVALFGDRRDYVVLRSRVVLNIHGTWQSSLELHRIQYLLSMGAAVVSERSAVDPHLDEEYADAVVFGGDASAILGSGNINTAEFLTGQIGDIDLRKNLGIIEDVEYVVTEEEKRNFDDILNKAFYLAKNTTARRNVERKAWQQYQKSVQNVTELQRAIELILLDVFKSPGWTSEESISWMDK